MLLQTFLIVLQMSVLSLKELEGARELGSGAQPNARADDSDPMFCGWESRVWSSCTELISQPVSVY